MEGQAAPKGASEPEPAAGVAAKVAGEAEELATPRGEAVAEVVAELTGEAEVPAVEGLAVEEQPPPQAALEREA